jgi:AmmeMemoRadiSam system protein A
MNLTNEDKNELFRIARESVRSAVLEHHRPDLETESPALLAKAGAFVTLKKRGALRGCIGYLEPVKPLCRTVSDMAIAAAMNDPRFPSVTPEELDLLEYEISILGEFRTIKDFREIRVGEHGLLMRNGPYQGLLLPQVATDMNWDRETFLTHTCMKAGMAPQCWSDPNTEIQVFTATILEEE